MKNKIIRFLWFGLGILLVGGGIFAAKNPSTTLDSTVVPLGIVLLLTGIFHVVVFVTTKHLVYGSNWLLGEGVITVLISILLFRRSHLDASAIPYIFSMWAMFTGVSKFLICAEFRNLSIKHWGLFTLPGTICLVLGFLSFYDFMLDSTMLSTFVGMFFIVQGISAFMLWRLSRDIKFE